MSPKWRLSADMPLDQLVSLVEMLADGDSEEEQKWKDLRQALDIDPQAVICFIRDKMDVEDILTAVQFIGNEN